MKRTKWNRSYGNLDKGFSSIIRRISTKLQTCTVCLNYDSKTVGRNKHVMFDEIYVAQLILLHAFKNQSWSKKFTNLQLLQLCHPEFQCWQNMVPSPFTPDLMRSGHGRFMRKARRRRNIAAFNNTQHLSGKLNIKISITY